jgi:hypothetical protein
MGLDNQLHDDLESIRSALEHALIYPSILKLGKEEYDKAHAELQHALIALKRVRRVYNDRANGDKVKRY